VAIIENGVDFTPLPARQKYLLSQLQPPPLTRANKSGLPAGQGWDSSIAAAADNCDGTYDSFCERGEDNTCLLYGHNDYRGNLVGDGLSGWLLMTLNDVKHGAIFVLVSKAGPYTNKKTLGWKCENNAESCEKPLSEDEANAAVGTVSDCTDFAFEFSIDGKVTTWTSEQLTNQTLEAERLIKIVPLLDDRSFAPKGKTMDVELGIRVGGTCGRSAAVALSHVYWA
jgi:hypothetical protein